MKSGLFLLGFLIVLFAVYRLVSRKLASAEGRVRDLLRRYHALAAAGLSEQESLFRILTRRSGWSKLPPDFNAELIKRLSTKEDVFRFVSLAEGYRYLRQLPAVAASKDLEVAMGEVARWLGDFGGELQRQHRLKQAEFVQKLALRLRPELPFTSLSLAETYYKMERYAEALPLFEAGLAAFKGLGGGSDLPDGLQPGGHRGALKASYEEMYAACLKATAKQAFERRAH
jgi:tetratricopeptide (TPR) repeat protein